MSTGGLYDDDETAREAPAGTLGTLCQRFQGFIDMNEGIAPDQKSADFTVDGAAYYRVTPGQWRELMAMAPPGIRALNRDGEDPGRRDAHRTRFADPGQFMNPAARGMMTEEETRDMLACLGYPDAAVTMAVEHASRARPGDGLPPLAGHVVLRDGPEGLFTVIEYEREPAWPDLGLGWDVGEILAAIAVVDRHLDEAAPEIYRQDNEASRLLNHWRRIAGGPGCEVHEATEALNLSTGGNPRKGVTGSMDDVLAELGDTASSALLAIQSVTKDTGATWDVFITALAKALGRVPQSRPA